MLLLLGCTVSVNEHFDNYQPLVLYQNDADEDFEAFPVPVDSQGTIQFSAGETVNLACPGSSVAIGGSSLKSEIVEGTCKSGITFTIDGKNADFNTITCTKMAAHVAQYTGKTCGSNHKEIEIGFNTTGRFIKHITTCFDDVLQHAVYARNVISSGIAGTQVNFPRPSFQAGKFYNVKPNTVPSLYTKNGQRKTINKILGLAESDTSIIHNTGNFYLATGHYTPKGDFVYGSQQRLTFYYVNAAPQWQTFNAGNWNTMEANCRKLAAERNLNLEVYTGSYGVSTLPDAKGKEQELYLWETSQNVGIPIPAIFYKVVYEPESKAGIALLGLNNPYKQNVKSDILCTDVCDQVDWLTWKNKNITSGYSYCCEVDDFRKVIKELPNFTVTSLLK